MEQNADDRFRPLRSAVGQVLTFCLLALGSRPRPQRWRKQELEGLDEWIASDIERLGQVPETVQKSAKGDRTFYSTGRPNPDSSPAVTRSKGKHQSSESCRPGSDPAGQRDESPPDPSDKQTRMADILASARGTRGVSGRKASRSSRGQRSGRSTRGGRTRIALKSACWGWCKEKCWTQIAPTSLCTAII